MLFASLCKRWLIQNLAVLKVCSKSHYTDFHYNHVTRSFSSSSTLLSAATKSVPEAENGDESSFTASYLINSCGLSSENALSVSKKVHFETSVKPDSVLKLLRNYGFVDDHIAKLVLKRPVLLLANAEKNLVPKLEFLRSIRLSDNDIARLMSAGPTFFTLSLSEYIIPKYNLFKSLVGTGSEENIVKAISCCRVTSGEITSTNVVPNMNVLRELGTPESSILRMITLFPQAAFLAHQRFKETVDYLKAVGFDPSASTFIQAIKVISGLGEANLEEKFNIYARWGWSKEDAMSAFKYHPSCMAYTEKRITKAMDFFVCKMGFSSKIIASYPHPLIYSLEMRSIPRCLVAKVLSHNGLIKKDFNLGTLLKKDDKYFMRNYVIKFQEQVPQLRDVYNRKVDIRDLGIDFKDDTVDQCIGFKD